MTRLKKRRNSFILLGIGLVAALILLGACSPFFKSNQQTNSHADTSDPRGNGEETREITLYFSDEQAMYLVPEKRQVAVKDDNAGETVIKELLKGPVNPALKRTLPVETKLLSLSVEQETAYVNFSKEIINNNYRGSAGEIALVYSVVNSLAELPGIKQVQFLIDGKEVETIYGHMDTGKPVTPDWQLIKTE